MPTATDSDVIRRCVFRPYRKGAGPVFYLTLWDTYQTRWGKSILRYELKMGRAVLFAGSDFGCSPLHAIDSDETVAGVMSFLTLRPGDTDHEYFESYSPEQLAYCSEHAESLAAEVYFRFGDQ